MFQEILGLCTCDWNIQVQWCSCPSTLLNAFLSCPSPCITVNPACGVVTLAQWEHSHVCHWEWENSSTSPSFLQLFAVCCGELCSSPCVDCRYDAAWILWDFCLFPSNIAPAPWREVPADLLPPALHFLWCPLQPDVLGLRLAPSSSSPYSIPHRPSLCWLQAGSWFLLLDSDPLGIKMNI